jgi:hypothetical protein
VAQRGALEGVSKRLVGGEGLEPPTPSV